MSSNYLALLVSDALYLAFHFYISETSIYDLYFYNRYFSLSERSMSAYRARISSS